MIKYNFNNLDLKIENEKSTNRKSEYTIVCKYKIYSTKMTKFR